MAVIPFDRVRDYERLPVDSQDVVTKARIVVAGQPTGGNFTYSEEGVGDAPLPEYYPEPAVVTYEHPQHATYGAERSFGLPKGVNPFLPPTHAGILDPQLSSGWSGAPASLRDGNPDTFVEYVPGTDRATANIDFLVTTDALQGLVGVRVTYSLELEDQAPYSPVFLEFGVGEKIRFGGGSRLMRLRAPLPESDGSEVTLVSLKNATANFKYNLPYFVVRRWKDALGDTPEVVSLKVHEAYPLVLNRDLLTSIAKAQIRLPASTPRRVTVRGYLPPGDLTHTITGWPGGDYTGVVARQSYREGNTIVDFEQAGAPPGVPQDALEAERVRTNRTRELVRAATYPTLVGNHVTR